MSLSRIICGDVLQVLPTLPKARMIFSDPPDNLGMKYDGYDDKMTAMEYYEWLEDLTDVVTRHGPCVWWLSVYYRYLSDVLRLVDGWQDYDVRLFLWRFTFGQHRNSDCGNGFRPLVRLSTIGMPWYTDAIRVQSQRQRNGDKRADPRGRVPDDVWEFPRVCGTYHERCQWHPNQHPEALVERMVKMSCRPGDLVIDLFSGTGTAIRVCKRLGIDCIGIEQSRAYCEKIADETGAELVVA